MTKILPIKIDLPSTFFEEEERCSYLVTTQMKKIWAVELDLLNELMRVCEKHNLHFWAEGGTLLGAVRHNGYIPWDDDIDIAMLRDDYNKLCSIASSEFKNPYFLQIGESDVGYIRPFARLRNSKTTGIQKEGLDYPITYNRGIFIDIFPQDNVPTNPIERQHFIKKLTRLRTLTATAINMTEHYRRKDSSSFWLNFRHTFKHWLYLTILYPISNYRKQYNHQMVWMQKYKETPMEYIHNLSLFPINDRFLRKREWYDSTIYIPFEMLSIPIPAHYNEILTQQYGDWHKMVKGGAIHGDIIFDVTKPYTQYLNELCTTDKQ